MHIRKIISLSALPNLDYVDPADDLFWNVLSQHRNHFEDAIIHCKAEFEKTLSRTPSQNEIQGFAILRPFCYKGSPNNLSGLFNRGGISRIRNQVACHPLLTCDGYKRKRDSLELLITQLQNQDPPVNKAAQQLFYRLLNYLRPLNSLYAHLSHRKQSQDIQIKFRAFCDSASAYLASLRTSRLSDWNKEIVPSPKFSPRKRHHPGNDLLSQTPPSHQQQGFQSAQIYPFVPGIDLHRQHHQSARNLATSTQELTPISQPRVAHMELPSPAILELASNPVSLSQMLRGEAHFQRYDFSITQLLALRSRLH